MRLALTALAGLLLALAAPPTVAQQVHSHGGGHEVRLVMTSDSAKPFAFEPSQLTMRPGETVRWVNDEDVFHTVTFTDSQEVRRPNSRFDESLSGRGESVAFTFTEPGTYHYYCQPHSPFMFGTITVSGAAGGSPPPGRTVPGLDAAGVFVLLAVAGLVLRPSRAPGPGADPAVQPTTKKAKG